MQPPEQLLNSTIAARKRVQVGPIPPWVVPVAFQSDLPTEPEEHCTQLLLCRQTHIESQATYLHSAVRLETMQAVQQISQWRLQFQPETETIIVHWVRIQRGAQTIDYTQPERFRILQREEGLETFVVDGSFTLLLLLEDVRVGDILETCCTRESRPKLMPDVASAFFSLPPEGAVGKYHFSLRCKDSRPVKWKASHKNLTPTERQEAGEIFWSWEGERYVAPKTEWNTPDWYSESRWIQFSDISDWQSVSAAVSEAWPNEDDDSVITQLLREITEGCPGKAKQVEKVIRFVQDDYRYLSINWESGGRIPAAPSRVARRRFGDCKDLAFLLVHLLKRLEISARPVLVNTRLRGAVKTMLPTPDVFDHVVAEFTLDGQRRWVDAVAKLQGGDALQNVIPNFGAGLAIDATNGSLIEPPPIQPSVYEIKETILLDTTGAPSLLSVIVTAKGFHAEKLRHQFANNRREEIEKDRLQNCANRFVRAQRYGQMEVRDDRDVNEFYIAEQFEVNGFLQGSPNPELCICPLPLNSIFSILELPEQKERRSPFALPYPCDFIHKIELECSALQPIPFKRCNLGNQFLRLPVS